MTEETALIGWKAIADYLGWSLSKTISRRKEWQECGVFFIPSSENLPIDIKGFALSLP
jgi:hypothetical protein